MESLIAGLLDQFEDGRMTRRQLVQTLALAVTGGPAAAAVLAAQTPAVPVTKASEPTGWQTVWLDHISFQVSDYKRSVEFYKNLMGWTIRNDNGKTQATLDINGLGGIIIRNGRQNTQAATQPNADGANANRPPRPPLTGVINHVSWGIQPWDTDKVKAELERRGLNPRPDMVGDTFKSYHVYDPDGWDLQISNQTKESRSTGSGNE